MLPSRQQLAAAWTNTCSDRHCQASWWNHLESPSSPQPPALGILNTTALCHLVILGRKNCSRWYKPDEFGRANFAPGLASFPYFFPCWCNRVGVSWHGEVLPSMAVHRRKDHSPVFSGSMAQSGLSLQAANKNWMQSYGEQTAPSIANGKHGLPKGHQQ